MKFLSCMTIVSMFGKNPATENAKRAAAAKKRKAPDVPGNEGEKNNTPQSVQRKLLQTWQALNQLGQAVGVQLQGNLPQKLR